jgi:hypothetical protein
VSYSSRRGLCLLTAAEIQRLFSDNQSQTIIYSCGGFVVDEPLASVLFPCHGGILSRIQEPALLGYNELCISIYSMRTITVALLRSAERNAAHWTNKRLLDINLKHFDTLVSLKKTDGSNSIPAAINSAIQDDYNEQYYIDHTNTELPLAPAKEVFDQGASKLPVAVNCILAD